MAKKTGRPTKYDPKMCERVVDCGKEGYSRAELAAELGIAIQTMHNWEAAHPDFLEATTRARDLALAWWNRQGSKGIWAKSFNAAAYRLQVMNRFPRDWRDRQEVVVSNLYPDSPGFEFADIGVVADVRDRERNLEIAREHHPDAIVTDQSDIAVPTVAYLCECLGLPAGSQVEEISKKVQEISKKVLELGRSLNP